MQPNDDSRTLRDYLRVLRRRRTIILVTTAVAAFLALAYSLIKEPTYEATATISFKDPAEDLAPFGNAAAPSFQPEKQVAASARVITRDDVLEGVADDVGGDLEADDLEAKISTSIEVDSNLVAITVSDPDADTTAAIANAVAKVTRDVVQDEQRERYARAARDVRAEVEGVEDPFTAETYLQTASRMTALSRFAEPVEIIRPAEVPGSPASPKPVRDTLIAIFLGLLLGTGAAFVRHTLDRRVTDAHEIQDELGFPLVGYVRTDTLGSVGLASNGNRPLSDEDMETFRIMRANVDFLGKEQDLGSVVVTSALPEEGKSTVAACFAYANAIAGRRTILVECDVRRPVLAERFGVDPHPGLTDYLMGDAEPKEVLRSISVHGPAAVDVMPVIPAGRGTQLAAEMFGSKRFRSFLEQISRAYEMVVLDSPPLLPVGDTLELLPQVDGALLCVRLEQTTRDQAMAAKEAIDHLPPRPTGLVVTGVRPGGDDDYYGYYSFSHSRPPVEA